MAKLTLREVVAALERRLNAKPIKAYWRETRSDITHVVECNGVELVFEGLRGQQVKKAMEGLHRTEKKRFKHRAYNWMMRWEHNSPAIKFRVTLYVYDDKQHFIFTTTW